MIKSKFQPSAGLPVKESERDEWLESILKARRDGETRTRMIYSGDSMVICSEEDDGEFSVYDVQIRRRYRSWEDNLLKRRAVMAKLTDDELDALGLTME